MWMPSKNPQGYKKNKYLLLSKKQKTKISEGSSKHAQFCFDQKLLEVGLQKI